jgi:hypothetical protein
MKVKLKQDVTEEQFLAATFSDYTKADFGDFDLDYMKRATLEADINEYNELTVMTMRIAHPQIILFYGEDQQRNTKLIWDIVEQ